MRKPFKCPVCGGNGQVPIGFYSTTRIEDEHLHWTSTSAGPEPCRSCLGTGIAWGDKDNRIAVEKPTDKERG